MEVRLGYPHGIPETAWVEVADQKREADPQKAIEAREEIVRAKPIRREELQVVTEQKYPYLSNEDAAFCRAFRLSEDTFLELHDGIGAYKQLEIDRNNGRGTLDIPQLPSAIRVSDLETMKVAKLSEKQLASFLIGEQKDKVTESQKIVRMNESFAAQQKADVANEAVREKQQHDRLAEEVRVQYGYLPGTQSSKDAIANEMDKIKHGLRT